MWNGFKKLCKKAFLPVSTKRGYTVAQVKHARRVDWCVIGVDAFLMVAMLVIAYCKARWGMHGQVTAMHLGHWNLLWHL